MTRFINDDVKLRVGGRNAAKISIEELKTIIAQYAKKYVPDEYDEDEPNFDYLLPELMYSYETLEKDLKYSFDMENFTTQKDEFDAADEFVGYNTLDNGLTFLGFCAGGDWEFPVFGILYYDGKKLRAYIPTRGNMINTKSKSAFGNDEETDEEILAQYSDDPYNVWSVKGNSEAMIEDIKSRIVVK